MWNNSECLNNKILIDSDIIRHFIRGKKIDLLHSIFPNQINILDLVEHEICRSPKIRPIVQNFIKRGNIKRMNFPTGKRFLQEYVTLTKKYGTGEAACMAVALHTKDIIASNNLRDIKVYCTENSILFLTTMDFLFVAFKKAIMTEAEIDEFLYFNLTGLKPSRIPFSTLKVFIDSKPNILQAFAKTA